MMDDDVIDLTEPGFIELARIALHVVREARRAGLAVSNFPQDREAIDIRQHDVENNQVVIGGMDEFQGGCAVRRGVDRIPGPL